ncbi:uncharacterized protein LOC105195158 [Solenopsis invicta]|uniref:uncharacterized protein LOC105195158 n=1 Tax=Solenopsis invicta TaxID=13686 RepID=UPI00193D5923|nr:uncharacterized protein LOC105195158 [Solenopsis invicta]
MREGNAPPKSEAVYHSVKDSKQPDFSDITISINQRLLLEEKVKHSIGKTKIKHYENQNKNLTSHNQRNEELKQTCSRRILELIKVEEITNALINKMLSTNTSLSDRATPSRHIFLSETANGNASCGGKRGTQQQL